MAKMSLNELRARIGLTEFEFRCLLCLPSETICNASTREEVVDIYRNALEGSEEKYAAYCRWVQLSIEALNAAETPLDIQIAYDLAPIHPYLDQLAFTKWLTKCSTIEDLALLYHKLPDEHPLQPEVVRKMYKINEES
jgi:hypothetical protein